MNIQTKLIKCKIELDKIALRDPTTVQQVSIRKLWERVRSILVRRYKRLEDQEKKMTKTIWEVIEENNHKETAEEVLEAVLDYYKSKGMLITTQFKDSTKSKIMEFEAYQEGFLTHHAKEL